MNGKTEEISLRMLKSVAIIWVLFFGIQQAVAQNPDSSMFYRGVDDYKAQNYTASQQTFMRILKNYPHSRFLTATKLMLAKSYYHLHDYRSALIVSDNFLQIHPNSSYVDDIHFLRGKIYFQQQKYMDAVEDWLWVVYNGSDERLKEPAGNYIFQTMDRYLSEDEISRLNKKYKDEIFTGLVKIVHAQKLIRQGREEEGLQELENFIRKYPHHLYADIAREILEERSGAQVSGNHFLTLVSQAEATADISRAIAERMFYAAYEMAQREPEKKVIIDTIGVENDLLSTYEAVQPVMEDLTPLAVVGPLANDENAAFSMLSRYEFFPFISPVSSQKGLAALSPYAFQINPDAEIKGEFLADYAVNELGFKTFAILAPADDYGETMANSFEHNVLQNDAEVVEKQWYYSDTEDFSRQFKAIRREGFYIPFRDSILAENPELSGEEIREMFKQYRTEVLFSDEDERDIDSTQVASDGIDAVFIVTYPENIPYIAPQFAFHNIKTTLLGNEGWNEPELLKQQQPYLDGLIYVTAGYFDSQSWNYQAFKNRFREQMHVTPGMYHLLGYDIGKWMLLHYEPGMTRQEYRDRLAGSDLYKGVLENIGFGSKPRVNSQLNIIKFEMGQILKIR